MPIFEYKCGDCDSKYEVLHKSLSNQQEVECPECGSKNSKKLLSSFSASMGSSSNFDGGCATGNCGIPAPTGGCASGMCGLN